MSPFSTPVLVGAALVSSPALWNVLQGTAPAEVAPVQEIAVPGGQHREALARMIADAPTEQLPVV